MPSFQADEPHKQVIDTQGEINHDPKGAKITQRQVEAKNKELSQKRSAEIKAKTASAPTQWSSYPQESLDSPMKAQTTGT
ncbi:hypothetical protein [Mesorhizobium sp. ES1-3]|uniref:hypothetical protein n=1 Tax=Mesorhizobium sp. ES1-3 TaxID=2876628 RepID=UPI001CCB43DF|nr:hypothetical protein [Mesorhizobium sp. ES1-3]MBZ9674050.1 hypothetical protein [Mesorhizobium sp. ES1-3]